MLTSSRLLFVTVVVSIFAVYTVAWSILEPIPVLDKYQSLRWIFLLIISILLPAFLLFKRGIIRHIVYRYIHPMFVNTLQSLNSYPDESLSQGWFQVNWDTHEGNELKPMQPEIVDDLLFKKACRFVDSKTHDAVHGIKIPAKERGTKIDYFLKAISDSSRNHPVIYISIVLRRISNPEEEINEKKWLTLEIDKVHTAETSKMADNEQRVYVQSKSIYMDWMFFSIDIPSIVGKIAQWKDSYAFNNIESIKVRGSFQLASIRIY